jgi:N-acetylglucosaminyl-diphospho-decaprenol L-rhamnosyltransferase
MNEARTVDQVDVVILTWNDGHLLEEAVQSALASVDVEVRVLVVDNGSEPAASVPPDPRVRVVRSDRNLGVAAGRNRGIRECSGRVVCLLDSDARLHPNTLSVLLHRLDDSDRVGMVVPVFDDQAPEASAGPAPTLTVKMQRLLGRRADYRSVVPEGAPEWDVDFGIGACQLFSRHVYDAVGGIDERYFYGPEDVDFCLRIREASWRIIQVRAAGCIHPPRRRFRRKLDVRTIRHAGAVVRHLWRHRRFESVVSD